MLLMLEIRHKIDCEKMRQSHRRHIDRKELVRLFDRTKRRVSNVFWQLI